MIRYSEFGGGTPLTQTLQSPKALFRLLPLWTAPSHLPTDPLLAQSTPQTHFLRLNRFFEI
jgi:hypothetical protein